MNTYLWRCTHPRDGCVITKDHLTEVDALRLLPGAERVEGTDVVAPIPTWGHAFASGLVRREDGAMVQRA